MIASIALVLRFGSSLKSNSPISPDCWANLFSISACATCRIDLYVAVADGEGDGVAAIVGVEVGVTDGVGVGATLTVIFTPLFQTIFLPDLMHVYFTLPTTALAPTFEQLAPDFIAALEVPVLKATSIKAPKINPRKRFIS